MLKCGIKFKNEDKKKNKKKILKICNDMIII